MGKHLLVAYSWSVNNIGDIGITPGLLNLLAREKEDLPVVVIASQSEDSPAYARIKEYLPRYKKNCETLPNPFPNYAGGKAEKSTAWKNFSARWGAEKLESFRKGCLSSYESERIVDDILEKLSDEVFAELKSDNPTAAKALENAGFVLYNSGTTFNFGRLGVRNLWGFTLPFAMPLIIARKLGLPYGVNAQSFDALDWPMELLYKKLFADARFVYCRDSDSLNYLYSKGLANRNSGYRPDSTFFFKGFDEEWADAFTRDNRLREKDFICVIMRISSSEATLHDPTGGTVSEERKVRHAHKIRVLIEEWIRRTKGKALICHETRDTLETIPRYLLKTLPSTLSDNIAYLDKFWTSEQAYSIFKRARIVVSMEMHSIIMSVNVGTPIIHNPFDECGRKKWMLNDLGLGDYLVDIDSCPDDALAKKALRIHDDFQAVTRQINDLKGPLEARALETLKEVWSAWRR